MDGHVPKPLRTEVLRARPARVSPDHPAQTETDNSSVSPRAAVLDREELLNRMENDDSLAREILAMFQTDAVAYLESLRNAVKAENRDETRAAAHAFKGMLANLAAHRASSSAAHLEDLAKANAAGEFAEALRQFETELQLVIAEVDAFLSGVPK